MKVFQKDFLFISIAWKLGCHWGRIVHDLSYENSGRISLTFPKITNLIGLASQQFWKSDGPDLWQASPYDKQEFMIIECRGWESPVSKEFPQAVDYQEGRTFNGGGLFWGIVSLKSLV